MNADHRFKLSRLQWNKSGSNQLMRKETKNSENPGSGIAIGAAIGSARPNNNKEKN